MFIGHYGVAFAAKRVDARVSLGTYVMAAQFLDLLWPILLIAGVEHVRITPGATAMTPLDFYDYPYSHSLVMAIVWAAVVGGAIPVKPGGSDVRADLDPRLCAPPWRLPHGGQEGSGEREDPGRFHAQDRPGCR